MPPIPAYRMGIERKGQGVYMKGMMKSILIMLASLILLVSVANAETGFDSRYQRDYNIFDPTNKYASDNPLNPANRFASDNPFNPVNKYDPNNPANPVNQFNPNNPFNPVNQYNPKNPLNPANEFNSQVPFEPLR